MERTNFMQTIITATQSQVPIEAVLTGFDGSRERCIAKALKNSVVAGNSEAEVILQAAGGDYLKAAHIITLSEITETI